MALLCTGQSSQSGALRAGPACSQGLVAQCTLLARPLHDLAVLPSMNMLTDIGLFGGIVMLYTQNFLIFKSCN